MAPINPPSVCVRAASEGAEAALFADGRGSGDAGLAEREREGAGGGGGGLEKNRFGKCFNGPLKVIFRPVFLRSLLNKSSSPGASELKRFKGRSAPFCSVRVVFPSAAVRASARDAARLPRRISADAPRREGEPAHY